MRIGGFQKTSLLDYPEHISAIVWTVGCNFRCPFCYNTELVNRNAEEFSQEEIFSYLKKRKDMLEALVISGGEPLQHDDIEQFCKKVKDIGYKIKIDTNGTFPDKLQNLIDKKLVDYVSMDVKAPVEKYDKLAGRKVDISKIKKTIKIIQDSNIDYEFKTTYVPDLLKKEDIANIADWLKGSKKFYLQQYKNDIPVISSELNTLSPYPREYVLETLEKVKPCFEFCDARGL